MKKLLFAVAIPVSILWIFSCKTTADDYIADAGYDYFPLEVGKYKIYEVDSTIFDPTGDSMVILSRVLIKEEITDTLTDHNGNLLYRIERYQRKADTLAWQISKVFTASVQDNKAIVTEDNLRFIRMVFPPKERKSWNGNAHFNPTLIITVAGESLEMFKGWSYRIESQGVQDTVGTFIFDDVVTVQEADNENLIELRRAVAKYARGAGLVYRELWILDTQCIDACAGQYWEEKAEKGFILKQRLISYN